MTDQSRTPVPPQSGDAPESKPEGASLFERAAGAFGLGKAGDLFRPAPMPPDLSDTPARRVRIARTSKIDERAIGAEETHAPVSDAPAVRFPGDRHPVDRELLWERGMILPEGAVTALLEEFRIVKRQVLLATREAQRAAPAPAAQRVLICSPLPGEGKTFCATNLALAIAAEKDSEVLLVDADFAKPSILSTLGLPGGPGLMDALADPSIKVEDCVLGTDVPGLWVLPAGNQTAQDSEYLASSRTRQVLDRLTQGAPNRMVIFDSPPVLAASPAAELAKYTGQTVLVTRADSTGQRAIEDALTLLSACPDIKLLLNDARFSPSGRRFGSYYGYGE